MEDILNSQWRPSEEAMANIVGDEMVILHLGNRVYFGLDAIGTEFWERLGRDERPDMICAAIAEDYDVELGSVEQDIRNFMAELIANDLIVRA